MFFKSSNLEPLINTKCIQNNILATKKFYFNSTNVLISKVKNSSFIDENEYRGEYSRAWTCWLLGRWGPFVTEGVQWLLEEPRCYIPRTGSWPGDYAHPAPPPTGTSDWGMRAPSSTVSNNLYRNQTLWRLMHCAIVFK